MSSEVKPVAGQWYEWQGSRVYCVGQDSRGHTIVNNECGTLNILRGRLIEELTHLPDCTGWDWQPETFPQHWTTLETGGQAAFIKLISESQWVCVRKDGSETQRNSYVLREMLLRDRTRLTEAEALALLDPKPQPLCNGCGKKLLPENAWMEDGCPCNSPKGVNDPRPAEDPEEWVEITDPEHVLRRLVDHYFSLELNEWTTVFESHGKKWRESNVKDLRVRCRRKDLPAKKRTITVPKWLCRSWQNWHVVECSVPLGWDEVHRVGETTYEIEGV